MPLGEVTARVRRWRDFVIVGRWAFVARSMVAFLAGTVAVFSMAPFYDWQVLLFSFPVFVLLLDFAHRSARPLWSAVGIGVCFGIGYFGIGFHWVTTPWQLGGEAYNPLGAVAQLVLTGGLSAMLGGACAVAATTWWRGWVRILIFAMCLSVVEWLRSHILSGFPLSLIVYGWSHDIAVVQWASFVGPFGMGFILAAVCSLPVMMIAPRAEWGTDQGASSRFPHWVGPGVVLGFAFLCLYGVGTWRINQDVSVTTELPTVAVRLVHPNIPYARKTNQNEQVAIFEEAIELSRSRHLDDIELVIWPEAITTFDFAPGAFTRDQFDALLEGRHVLIAGTPSTQFKPGEMEVLGAYNATVVFNEAGDPVGEYRKTKLVPFGEVMPLDALLRSLGVQPLSRVQQGMLPGDGLKTIKLPNGLTIAPLICYEAVFPAEVITPGPRPDLIVVTSDETWMGPDWGPQQHFAATRFRAVEEGIPLVRVAEHGVSGVVDAYGRILARHEGEAPAIWDEKIPLQTVPTLYARYGDLIYFVMLFTAFLIVLGANTVLIRRHS